jgi:PhnB protein
MTQTSKNSIPNGLHTITPHLVCNNAVAAISFYQKAFGATEMMRLADPAGKLMHASIRIGDSTVMLVDEYPDYGSFSPKTLKGTPVTIHMYVDDVDAAFKQAVDAGAVAKMPPADMFWGDRYGLVVDPFGHQWSLATHIRDVTIGEMQEEMKNMGSNMCSEQK